MMHQQGSKDFAGQLRRISTPIAIMPARSQPSARSPGERYRVGQERIIAKGSSQRILESYYCQDRAPVNGYGELKKFQQFYTLWDGK